MSHKHRLDHDDDDRSSSSAAARSSKLARTAPPPTLPTLHELLHALPPLDAPMLTPLAAAEEADEDITVDEMLAHVLAFLRAHALPHEPPLFFHLLKKRRASDPDDEALEVPECCIWLPQQRCRILIAEVNASVAFFEPSAD
jgi:hypothetical protein